jgi:hypothetical protein
MLKPRMPVRRFDVFAEYNRLEAVRKGLPEDEAAGYGLWVAKVVASGGGRRSTGLRPPRTKGQEAEGTPKGEEPEKPHEKWHTLGGEEQTDELFEKEIINRMGSEFYYKVFQPAMEEAVKEDRSYQSIRDTIRKDWKP